MTKRAGGGHDTATERPVPLLSRPAAAIGLAQAGDALYS